MTLRGWCGRCGESFALVDVLAADADSAAAAGACPSCGALFAPGYTTVLAVTLRELLAAADALAAAAHRARDVAPALHVDERSVDEMLRAAFEPPRHPAS